jgi:hypothetical protein
MIFAEAAEAVLADTHRAMTADKIWIEIEHRGLVEILATGEHRWRRYRVSASIGQEKDRGR